MPSGQVLRPARRCARAARTYARPQAPPTPARTLLDVFNATALRCEKRTAIDAADGGHDLPQLSRTPPKASHRACKRAASDPETASASVSRAAPRSSTWRSSACSASGAAYVPIEADDPPARADECLRALGACAVVGDGLAIDRARRAARGAEREPDVDDDAWVIFTSGSTGAPKGVAVSHRAAAAFVDAEARALVGRRRGPRARRALGRLRRELSRRSGSPGATARRSSPLRARSCAPAPSSDRGSREHGVSVVSTVPTLAAMWDDDIARRRAPADPRRRGLPRAARAGACRQAVRSGTRTGRRRRRS